MNNTFNFKSCLSDDNTLNKRLNKLLEDENDQNIRNRTIQKITLSSPLLPYNLGNNNVNKYFNCIIRCNYKPVLLKNTLLKDLDTKKLSYKINKNDLLSGYDIVILTSKRLKKTLEKLVKKYNLQLISKKGNLFYSQKCLTCNISDK